MPAPIEEARLRLVVSDEKAKMRRGERYDPNDPTLVAERAAARELTAAYNETGPRETTKRGELLGELFGTVSADATVEPPFRCDYGDNIHVGAGFYANFDCVILDVCRVEFGENCLLGPGVHVYTATHSLDAAERRTDTEYGKPVSVGDDVWIGGNAVLNPGVTIGERSVVASGAVVTEDVPSDVVVQGNPAEVVRRLEE